MAKLNELRLYLQYVYDCGISLHIGLPLKTLSKYKLIIKKCS